MAGPRASDQTAHAAEQWGMAGLVCNQQHRRPGRVLSGELSRLLSAAVVSSKFAQMLLTDRERTLDAGYLGELFELSPTERELVLSIRARTLSEFAAGLRTHSPASRAEDPIPASSAHGACATEAHHHREAMAVEQRTPRN